jgi:acid phosphatase family membrane protein YuiD
MHGVAGTPFNSSIFWSGVSGWMMASILKILVNWHRTRRVDFHYLTSLGGMPSAHSAMVSALATSVGLCEGFGSGIFVVTLVFSMLIMFDASTCTSSTELGQIGLRNKRDLPKQRRTDQLLLSCG